MMQRNSRTSLWLVLSCHDCYVQLYANNTVINSSKPDISQIQCTLQIDIDAIQILFPFYKRCSYKKFDDGFLALDLTFYKPKIGRLIVQMGHHSILGI